MTIKQKAVDDLLLEFQRQDHDAQRMIVRDLCHSNSTHKIRFLLNEYVSYREGKDEEREAQLLADRLSAPPEYRRI